MNILYPGLGRNAHPHLIPLGAGDDWTPQAWIYREVVDASLAGTNIGASTKNLPNQVQNEEPTPTECTQGADLDAGGCEVTNYYALRNRIIVSHSTFFFSSFPAPHTNIYIDR